MCSVQGPIFQLIVDFVANIKTTAFYQHLHYTKECFNVVFLFHNSDCVLISIIMNSDSIKNLITLKYCYRLPISQFSGHHCIIIQFVPECIRRTRKEKNFSPNFSFNIFRIFNVAPPDPILNKQTGVYCFLNLFF